MTSTSPYWLSEPAPPLLSAAVDGTPDVEVVGAGVTGCSCALALARAGFSVRVHDARQVAGGASGRNGGFALRGGAMPYDSAREWLGRGTAQAYWRWTEAALDRLEPLAGDSFPRLGRPRLPPHPEEPPEL